MQSPTLTKEQVLQAERREGIYHPVIEVLENRAAQIARFMESYQKLSDTQEQQRFVHNNLGFLADDIEALEGFTVSPLELMAIWSKAYEMMSYYPLKNGLGIILPAAYSTKGIQTPQAWKGFPRMFLEKYGLPEGAQQDREGLLYVKNRAEQIAASLDEIVFYKDGIRNGMRTSNDLAKKAYQQGDKKAEEELDRLVAYEKEHETPVMRELLENLGYGLSVMRMKLPNFSSSQP